MGSFALLALLSGLLMSVAFDSGDDAAVMDETDPDDSENPDTTEDLDDADTTDDPEDPDPMLDTGAHFDQTEDGVVIDVGDDETGTVAVVYYTDSEDREDGVLDADEARFYLVPEDVDWSDASWENRFEVPGQSEFDGPYTEYELAEFEEQFGLELLGVVDLTGVEGDAGDPASRVGEIISNEPFDEYFLDAQTDGDELLSFMPVDYVVTNGDVPFVSVTSDTIGTDGADRLSADGDGITIDGTGGNDFLTTRNANVTLIGGLGNDDITSYGQNDVLDAGDGDDFIRAYGSNTTIDGGAGNDTIESHSGTATGGEGDDVLRGYNRGDGPVLLDGGAGNDRVFVFGDGSQGYGGEGDDFIALVDGTTGYGDEGNDMLQVDSGATAYGGDGDDFFKVWNQFRNDDGPTVVTGGAGADTFDARVWNARDGEADNIYMTITDFDPTEDVLQVGVFQTGNNVDSIEIVEADDGSYSDVRVTYTPQDGLDPGIAVIRLEGTTGVTADQIVITR